MGDRYGETSSAVCFKLMDGNDKTSRMLRATVLAGVSKLGGLKAEWNAYYGIVSDTGDYGQKEYHRESRWQLKVSVADRGSQIAGIKRRKLA